ncbi:MAG: extracellular solute-binding protein [Candidatus Liptonbacteria bacterium]|nr:extracellular solute-binding protein [Candidatus Liptonbacteria bacterium]
MHLTRQRLLIIGAAVVIVGGLIGAFFLGGRKEIPPEVKLTVWGTEPEAALRSLFEAYHKAYANVEVKYTELPASNYEQVIVEALAAGAGPDVFMVGNRDLFQNLNKVAPAPPALFSLTRLRELFPSVVEDDFARGGAVYALPLSIDTLALFYNRDYFDGAALVRPPATWEEFVSDAKALRVVSGEKITRAGAALGGSSRSVEQAADIVQLLMLQNGVPLAGAGGGSAAFVSGDQSGRSAGALNFYLQFANPGAAAYTWHDAMPPARESFAAGKAAMLVDYRAALPEVQKKSPFLRVGLAPVPQVGAGGATQPLGRERIRPELTVEGLGAERPASFARYRGFAVSKWSTWANDWAWRFVVSITTEPALVEAYLAASGTPPALRSEIAKRLDDPELGTFAKQALAARSWQAPGDARVRAVFDGAIQNVLTGRTDPRTALSRAEAEINQLFQAR